VSVTSINRLGWVCAGLITVILGLSIPLRCFQVAVPIVVVSSLEGAGMGAALAMVTRTKRPLAIYAWLAAAGLTLLPFVLTWPPGDSSDVFLWRGAPDILSNYFDLARGGAFLLAMPFPFARLGQHAPDPLPPDEAEPPD
jgi:hypothetical protein